MTQGLERRWYELSCETLSPVHTSLGPAALLIPGEECDTEGQLTYVLDRPGLIAALQARPAPAPPPRRTYRDILRDPDHPNYDMTRQLAMAGWIKPDDPIEDQESEPATAADDWAALAARRPRELPAADKLWRRPEGRELVRYLLNGTPNVPGGEGWWESISRVPRTPDGRILLPGSELKGALRSLLAYAMSERIGVGQLPPSNGNSKRAAQPLEQRTLAPNAPRRPNGQHRDVPNYDAGRLLLVRDTVLDDAVRAHITPFGLRSVRGWRPFNAGTEQSAAAVEAIPPGTTFGVRFAIDVALLRGWRDRQGKDVFAPLREVLSPDLAPLLAAGRAYAAAMLEADIDFYRRLGVPAAAALSEDLHNRLAGLPANATLLRLGWGAGRQSKTPFGVLLGQPPPRSRRLTVSADRQPGLPFGWVLCTLSAR